MIVTQPNALRIIKAAYGQDFKVRFSATSTRLGVRPVHETSIGKPTLAWIKLTHGKTSAVRIGRMLDTGAIDWAYSV